MEHVKQSIIITWILQELSKSVKEVAIRLSYYIYCRRNKISSDPELISYTNGFNIRIYL